MNASLLDMHVVQLCVCKMCACVRVRVTVLVRFQLRIINGQVVHLDYRCDIALLHSLTACVSYRPTRKISQYTTREVLEVKLQFVNRTGIYR